MMQSVLLVREAGLSRLRSAEPLVRLGNHLEIVLANGYSKPLLECGLVALLRVLDLESGAIYVKDSETQGIVLTASRLPVGAQIPATGQEMTTGLLARAARVRGSEVLNLMHEIPDAETAAFFNAGFPTVGVCSIPALGNGGGFVLVCLPAGRVLNSAEMKSLQWVSTLLAYGLAQAGPGDTKTALPGV